MMMTSTPAMPSSISLKTWTPRLSRVSVGSRVFGPTTRTSETPRVFSASIWERATRECRMSPMIATFRGVKSPLCCRIVNMSSMACVGCACCPSPALMMLTPGLACRAKKCAAPLSACLMTNMSTCIASRFLSVSSSDSPLAVADVLILRFRTSADRRFAASSKVVRVRVLFSKKRFATALPRRAGTFLTDRSLMLRNDSAVSRIRMRCSRLRPSIERKCRILLLSSSCRLAALIGLNYLTGGCR